MEPQQQNTPKYYVDQDACVGCGMCYSSFPDLFEAQADGKSKAKNDGVITPQNTQEVDNSINMCPFGAIKK